MALAELQDNIIGGLIMFKDNRIIPVIVLNDEQEVIEKLNALHDGGISIAEIAFRNEFAPHAIEIAIKRFPNMIIGAGTVINVEQAKKAYELGAKFIVSPGLSKEVALFSKEKGILYIPGCVTPTEIMVALDLGLMTIKFFPADVYGGLKALKALSAPFPQVKFVPTGGINLSNLKEYLSFDKVVAVGGSFMMKGNIKENCKAAVEIIKSILQGD